MVTDTERARSRQVVRKRRAYVLRKNPHPDCHLCGQPIDMEARYPAPGSFVVDHVIPLAKGGPDEATNWAAAHRACNSRKSAKLLTAQQAEADAVRRSPLLHSGSILVLGCSCTGCLRYVHREQVATARGAAA